MTEYSDVPQVNALYQESQQIDQAIAIVDDGGRLAHFMLTPMPPPGTPAGPGVQIMVPPGPPDQALMADIRASLVSRQDAILAELAALGVTATPPAKK